MNVVKPKNECAGHGELFLRTVGSWNTQDKQGTPEQKKTFIISICKPF